MSTDHKALSAGMADENSIQALFSAEQLAGNILTAVDEVPRRADALRPLLKSFESTLRISFAASLEQEEGRPVRFNLLFHAGEQLHDYSYEITDFDQKIPLTEHALKKLSPSCDAPNLLLLIEVFENVPMITGVVDLGTSWSAFMAADTAQEGPFAPHLIIRATGVGSMTIAFGDIELFTVSRAKAAEQALNVLKRGPVQKFFETAIRQACEQAVSVVDHEVIEIDSGLKLMTNFTLDQHNYFLFAGEYLRVLARLFMLAADAGHGGMIVIVNNDERNNILQHIDIKYQTTKRSAPWDLFLKAFRLFLEPEAYEHSVKSEADVRRTLKTVRRLFEIRDGRVEKLRDYVSHLAKCTQVDGALVLTDFFDCVGFGGVVRDLQNVPSFVDECLDAEGNKTRKVSINQYGTRHRSAAAISLQLDCIAFVMSQDGGVKAFKRGENGTVKFWKDVGLSPTAWFPTFQDMKLGSPS